MTMRKLLGILLAAVLLLSCLPLSAGAAVAGPQTPRPAGDVNGDGILNAKDVTVLRRCLAGGYGVKTNFGAADVNADTVVSAKDVTILRRYLAGGYGVTVGTYVLEPELQLEGAVTGGALYEALGAPVIGEGGYTLSVFSDGVEQNAAPYAEKITAGNTSALTLEDSVSEVVRDELEKTITLRTQMLFTDGTPYSEVTLSMTEPGRYRLLGRAWQDTDGVVCDCSADGVEFKADCKGEILLTVDASVLQSTYLKFRVIVDGAESDQIGFRAKGEQTLPAGVKIPRGMHTIRIVKDTVMCNSKDVLKSVTLTCAPDSICATKPKAKLLEVIGDSTSAGYGIIETDTPETTTNSSCAIYTYGYRAADALDMDYDMLVKGTTGVLKQAGAPVKYNQRELYDFQNRYRDAAAPRVYARKADAVLFKLSGNDGSFADEEVDAALRDLFRMVRERHGADTPILLLFYGKSSHQPVVQQLLEDPLIFAVKGVSDGKGMGTHPSKAAHDKMTENVIEVLRPLMEG